MLPESTATRRGSEIYSLQCGFATVPSRRWKSSRFPLLGAEMPMDDGAGMNDIAKMAAFASKTISPKPDPDALTRKKAYDVATT